MRKSAVRRVALVVELGSTYSRDVAEGVAEYGRDQGRWEFLHHLGSPFLTWEQAIGSRSDGVIAPIRTSSELAQARSMQVVNFSSMLDVPEIPGAFTDDSAVGHEAALHLGSLGMRCVTCLVDEVGQTGKLREQAFKAKLPNSIEYAPSRLFPGQLASPSAWRRQLSPLKTWLRKLPKPVAIFATHNRLAALLCDLCQEEGLLVPEQVAILGVHRDYAAGAFRSIQLSYIPLKGREVGRLVARQLNVMMEGGKLHRTHILVPPLPTRAEKSTAYIRVDDPLIRLAVERLEGSLESIYDVGDMRRGIPLSRRGFEIRFRDAVGRSPYEELQRVRVERTKRMLAETQMRMEDIAKSVGWTDARHLSVAFHKAEGMPPTEYRRRHGWVP